METFKKKPFAAILVAFFLALCDATMQNQKSTYIVHVAKSEMPDSFGHHSHWYDSILKSVSDSADMVYTYDIAIQGFATRLTPEEALSLKNRNGVLKVLPEKIYKPLTTRTPHFLGLDIINDMSIASSNGSEGSDVIIGILDTGVWPESKSFDDKGMGPIPKHWRGKCESGKNFTKENCNKKMIGARFFYKGHLASMGPLDESSQLLSPRDDDGHGTHTASTAAGSVVFGANLFGFANGTARGMAPRARIAVYKVCWDSGCLTSDVLSGMEKAISDNVNVISVSLGSSALDYDEDSLAIGAFAAMEKGIVVSCSAGNEGPKPSSLSNVAPWMITVGAGTLDRDFPAGVTLGNGKKYRGVSLYRGDASASFILAENASVAYPDMGSKCETGSLDPKKVKGKIVLCDRGDTPRSEKGFVVKNAGGVGMVLVNSKQDGEGLVADAHVLPTTAVGYKAGQAIKKYLSSNPKPTAKIEFNGTKLGIKPSPIVASFSSRGPNTITPQILKPDLIAPGVNIIAAWSRLKPPTDIPEDTRRVDFNIISGTSMSCPHVSGLAALIKAAHPDWSPAAIRSALMTTAYTAYPDGKKLQDSSTNKRATPFEFGAGHVDPGAALNPGLVYDLKVTDYLNFLCALNYTAEKIETVARRKYTCDKHKKYSVTALNYPSFGVVFEKDAKMVKHTRTLTNVGEAATYNATVTADIPNDVKIMIKPNVLSFKTHEKKSFSVTFIALSEEPKKPLGFGRLEWSDGKKVVGSPISILWGSPGLGQ
ncbi:hypothetical protein RJT34_05695 [Clitoria ternatea]|uniref:Uncharacterized protein n=1 Tax=Clitoria ternatea TaxID=43366 RepID=A0AAN9PSQ8_CLITE